MAHSRTSNASLNSFSLPATRTRSTMPRNTSSAPWRSVAPSTIDTTSSRRCSNVREFSSVNISLSVTWPHFPLHVDGLFHTAHTADTWRTRFPLDEMVRGARRAVYRYKGLYAACAYQVSGTATQLNLRCNSAEGSAGGVSCGARPSRAAPCRCAHPQAIRAPARPRCCA